MQLAAHDVRAARLPNLVSGSKTRLPRHRAPIRAETHTGSRQREGCPGAEKRSARSTEAVIAFWHGAATEANVSLETPLQATLPPPGNGRLVFEVVRPLARVGALPPPHHLHSARCRHVRR